MIPDERPVIADSLWTATANRSPAYPALCDPQQADVAIIGGGYTGLSAALHLAQAGADVVLLEARQPGWGASGRNGGQINPGLKDGPAAVVAKFGKLQGQRMIEMSSKAADLVFDLIAKYKIDCDAVRPGWIRGAHTPKTLRALHDLAADWQEQGAAVAPLYQDEIVQMTGTDAYLGGLIDRRGGSLHPLNYALGLAEAATGHGARIFGNAPVTRMTASARGHHIYVRNDKVTAARVLVCTNAYTGNFHPQLAQSVMPVRSVQVATAPLSDNLRASILPDLNHLSDTRRLLLYFRMDADGRFIMGGRGTYNDASTARQMAGLRQISQEIFPQLAGATWAHAWGGNVAVTRDHYPHLHLLAPDMMAGLGYNGRGVAMATAMGRVLADWALGADCNDLDFPVTPLRPLLFAFARKAAVTAEILRMRLLDRFGL